MIRCILLFSPKVYPTIVSQADGFNASLGQRYRHARPADASKRSDCRHERTSRTRKSTHRMSDMGDFKHARAARILSHSQSAGVYCESTGAHLNTPDHRIVLRRLCGRRSVGRDRLGKTPERRSHSTCFPPSRRSPESQKKRVKVARSHISTILAFPEALGSEKREGSGRSRGNSLREEAKERRDTMVFPR